MKLSYTVSKIKGSNVWYAHMVGFPNIPVNSERGTFVDKKTALHIAADSMGLPYSEYMDLRRKTDLKEVEQLNKKRRCADGRRKAI